MGFLVKKLKFKKKTWKVQFVKVKGGKRKIRDLRPDECVKYGFNDSMTLQEAQGRRDQLNADLWIKRKESILVHFKEKETKERKIQQAFLPDSEVLEFEKNHLYSRLSEDDIQRNKTKSHWNAARRALADLKLNPPDWYDQAGKFYDWFSKHKFSPSYVQKILPILNRYGFFLARKYKLAFMAIPSPRGREMQRIADACFEDNEKGNKSDPITPQQLENNKGHLSKQLYNWLKLSIWFGLRPHEVDRLKLQSNKSTWYIDKHQGTQILHVYQTKLTSIARDKRWKYIPCITKEQIEGLKLIETRDFKRPLSKTVRRYFGDQTTLYGGRKGFMDLMLTFGQEFMEVSTWLGHQSIERTWKDYHNKQTIRFKKVA